MDTLDVREGNERRKRLLQQILAQAAQQGGGAGGGASPFQMFRPRTNLGGMRNAFGRSDARSASPRLTLLSTVPPGLVNALGPGGFGRPGQHDASIGRGLPVEPPRDPGAAPRPPGLPAMPPTPPAGPMDFSPPPARPFSGEAIPPSPASTYHGGDIPAQPAPTYHGAEIRANLIPLGNGVFYDPVRDSLFGTGATRGRII